MPPCPAVYALCRPPRSCMTHSCGLGVCAMLVRCIVLQQKFFVRVPLVARPSADGDACGGWTVGVECTQKGTRLDSGIEADATLDSGIMLEKRRTSRPGAAAALPQRSAACGFGAGTFISSMMGADSSRLSRSGGLVTPSA